ncbi:MAG: hypothetical protein ABS46_13285 [Cytophagaceae bacterium SCN 52-12]|nr:MAG: hypothetical protein ABS46_13285 [Cytophagaceae bacterium SCN 52-12]
MKILKDISRYRKLLLVAFLAILQGCIQKQEYHVRFVPRSAIRPDGSNEAGFSKSGRFPAFILLGGARSQIYR